MYDNLISKIKKILEIDRPLQRKENQFVASWKEELGMKDDIILEAVKRAKKKDKGSFYYINGILENWYSQGVSNYSDILKLDEEHEKGKRPEQAPKKKTKDLLSEVIKIKYHTNKIEKLRYIDGKSDWIDLRAAEDVTLKKGDFYMIDLGISVKLPEGYEMIIAPRSSTYKNFGIIQANSIGIIDETYCGNDDHLKMPVIALRDTKININNRICQFRILKHQPKIEFDVVEDLGTDSRGGFGSTGID